MKTVKSAEEALFEKEGRGRFNLRASMGIYRLDRRSRSGPKAVATNLPVPSTDNSPVLPRVKLVPRLMKDAMGNDVRVFVPRKGRSRTAIGRKKK